MNISRRLLILLTALVLSAAVSGYLLNQRSVGAESDQDMKTLLEARQRMLEARAKAQQASIPRPYVDLALSQAVPKAYPRVASAWKASEKNIYQKLLSSGQFDVLVVPFQVQEYGLDYPTRSLMTAQLATLLAKNQKLRIADTYLVARALGDGYRHFDPQEVYTLAKSTGVKKIISGYVGHNRKNQMTVTIQVQEPKINDPLNAWSVPITKDFENIAFTDENPPIDVYQQLLPKILSALGINSPVVTTTQSNLVNIKIPESPLGLAQQTPEAAHDALYFQLLAALTPTAEQRTIERFAEKSLLAVFGLSPESSDYNVLKARAYMLLGLRPAALNILKAAKTPEEKELIAALNGNQPEVELYGSQIQSPIQRAIAKIDANYLSYYYQGIGKDEAVKKAQAVALPGKIWPFLTVRAFADLDTWAQFDNIYLKQVLDHEFPLKEYSLESLVHGASTLGDAEKLQTLTDLSVINHVRKLLTMNASKWCCQVSMAHPSEMDYLDLLEAIGNDDLMRRADFLTRIQGNPEQSLVFLGRIESVYKDYPRFTYALAEAQMAKSSSADGAEKEGLLKLAYINLFNVMFWEQGQSYLSGAAFDVVGTTGRRDYGYIDNYYASDYPFRSYYPNWEAGGRPEYMIPNAEAALANSTSDLKSFAYLDWYFNEVKQYDKHEALFKSLDGRFKGNPQTYLLRANNSLNKGDTRTAEKFFRESIKAQPNSWDSYMRLGTLLIEDGQLDEAGKLFMTYPDFKEESAKNRVGISNAAYEAGSRFYWLGEFDLAKPLYKIASRDRTGSDADMASQLRLNLLKGNFRAALVGSWERATRYNNSYAYRDYISMLHAFSHSEDGWAAFNVVVNQDDTPSIWESALVGHRIEGVSEGQIALWVKQKITQNIGKSYNRAANYLLRAGVTDRIPSKDFANLLSETALPVWKEKSPSRWILQPGDSYDYILGPRITESNKVDISGINDKDSQQKIEIKSYIVYFAEAYRAIKTGDYATAKTLLAEASTFYNLGKPDEDGLSYFLPYYAFSAAKTGDVTAVEKYISDFTPSEKSFDYLLTKAVILGMGGKIEESAQLLQRALYKRPFTERRAVQTEYQYAEICMWLYEETEHDVYKKLALDWAKKNQKFQPWFSWAYAMEATLTDNNTDRKKAIAMASYLDPQSEMLSKISSSEVTEAVRQFKSANPFLKIESIEKQDLL